MIVDLYILYECGRRLGHGVLRPSLSAFFLGNLRAVAANPERGIGPYLSLLCAPVLGIALMYSAIVLWFAGAFGFFNHLGLGRFSGLAATPGSPFSFWDFLNYSAMTVTTLGHSDIAPDMWLAHVLSVAEWVAGTGWLLVSFAALTALLTPRFEEIAKRQGPPGGTAAGSGLSADEVKVLREEMRGLREELIQARAAGKVQP